ncbi:MAG TPA: hypothetical protein DCZ40_10935 [Lachnospiraceae bacterium]|nr:hypothetical protein [Lachnospiraceae bacterium]
MYKIIVAPILGGIIGYITNDLAIKMLFHPRNSIYIGKFHIPFTPGLIPQQKYRIAKSIGRLGSRLLDEETLRDALFSQETVQRLREKMQEFWDSLKEENRTVREILELNWEEEKLNGQLECVRKQVADAVSAKVIQANLGQTMVEAVWNAVTERTRANLLFSSFSSDRHVKELFINVFESKINEIIAEKAPDMIEHEFDKLQTELLDTRICELYLKYEDKTEAVTGYVLQFYQTLLDKNIEKLLSVVDVEQIVTDKINSFDAAELENMIFGIMKRELKAIVYLGAVLGFCMGFINLLF